MGADVWLLFSTASIKTKTESGYIDEILEKATKLGIKLEIKNVHKFTILSREKNELYYDGKLVTHLPKIAIIRRYEIYLTRQLELMGVKVLNSPGPNCDARNKMKVHQILADKGISTPATVFSCFKNNYNNISYENTCKMLGSNRFVLKWLYGSQGKHVFLVDNKEMFDELVRKYKGRVLCQEYIEDSFGMDIRAYVINGNFLTAVIRKSSGNDFRSNLAQGGDALKVDYDENLIKIAEDAAKAIGLDICGVDVLVSKKGYYICEVNANPGFKSTKRAYGIDEIDIFINLMKEKLNK